MKVIAIIVILALLSGNKEAIGQTEIEVKPKTNIEMEELVKLVKGYNDYLLKIRRHIHQYPGVRFSDEETKTLDFIRNELRVIKENNPDSHRLVWMLLDGGLVADMRVNDDYDIILFRADVDALSMKEKTGLSFASKTPGVFHGCGHDIHAAMLLTAIKAMMENDLPLKHNLRFVFQRAEENPIDGTSGGKMLVYESKVNKGASEAYGLHVWAHEPGKNGSFMSRPDSMLGNSDRIKVDITAPGNHAAFPYDKSDALTVGLAFCEKMNQLANTLEKSNPGEYSLAPTEFHSGESSNVRPQEAELWFAGRNYLPLDKRDQFHQKIKEMAKKVEKNFLDTEIKVTPIYGHPTLINTPEVYDDVKKLLDESDLETESVKRQLGGEDFAHYLNEVPGNMWLLTAWQEGCGDHHTSTFNPDESVFWKGVLFWLLLATN